MTDNTRVKPYLIAYDRPTSKHVWRHIPLMDWGELSDAVRVRADWVRQMTESFEPTWAAWEYRIALCALAYPPETLPKTWDGGTLE